MNLMELAIKVFVDDKDVDKGLDDVESKTSNFTSKLGNGLKTAAKIGTAAVGVAATAVTTLTKSAVASYREYQQLEGGIETLYKQDAKQMMEYANKAFATAGMSVNDYMNTAIESSAAMINSLEGDTKKAAEMTNMAIIDMSDNVNKMGTSMESIQNAYRGFSRGNFTMLDNLSLGFAGTKEGMQQLLEKAQEFSGIEYDIDSYADIVEAIHVVQTEMGITGTTAKEGSETITGSMAAVKAAWQNLVTGLANPNADLGKLIDDVVDNAEVAFTNLIPTIEHALGGVADLIGRIAPIIAEKLPDLINEILPPLLEAAQSVIIALVENLPTILQVLIDQIPMLVNIVATVIVDALPMIVECGVQLLLAIVQGIAQAMPTLMPAIIDVIFKIVEILTQPDMRVQLITAGIQIIIAIIEGLIQAIPQLMEAVPKLIGALLEAIAMLIPELIAAGADLLAAIIMGMIESLGKVPEFVGQLFNTLKEGIDGIIDKAKNWGSDLITNFINGIFSRQGDVGTAMGSIAQLVASYIHFSEPEKGALANFHTYAPDMMKLFAEGIRENEDVVANQINDSFDFSEDMSGGIQATADATTSTENGGGSDAMSTIIALLQTIASKDIKFDEHGIYTLVQNQNNIYREANGGASGI